MKTKTLLLLCLFLGIGLTQLSAQNGKNHSYNVTADAVWGWYTPVYCHGVLVDELEGTGDAHFVDHYVNGVWQWEHIYYKNGVGTSDWTGETFKFTELDKFFYSKRIDNYEWTCDTHVKGDKGSLYNVTFIMLYLGYDDAWSTSVQNASCTGNAK
jgi:hypothetical protein